MSPDARPEPVESEIAALLRSPRYEIMPFDSFDEQLASLPDGAAVTVTASPSLGLDATIDKAERAADRGFESIPHLAARDVRDEAHLGELVERLVDVGVTDVFVPGGDRDAPLGPYASAFDLLSALRDLDHEFEEIGITGYPEGHPFLSEETLDRSLDRKRPAATYITTQLCYDPDAITAWIEAIRAREIDLPVFVGIPGALSAPRLLGISRRVGVGDSLRFLRRTTGVLDFLRRLIGARGTYTPDDLVTGVAARSGTVGIRGLHISTFNQVPATEAWRRSRLDAADGGSTPR